jgi:hypothetical protein
MTADGQTRYFVQGTHVTLHFFTAILKLSFVSFLNPDFTGLCWPSAGHYPQKCLAFQQMRAGSAHSTP